MSKQFNPGGTVPVPETLCSRNETTAILAISSATYWRLVRNGTLEVVRFGDRCTRVKRSSIDALMNKSSLA